MQLLFAFGLLVATALAVPSTDVVQTQWNSFKVAHNKQYSIIEEVLRRKIFESNLVKIEEHNAKYEQGLVSYKLGVNQFADMTAEEFMDYVNRSQIRPAKDPKVPRTTYVPSNVAIPAEVDWRSSGIITGVKNQGACGSCWSFSATGSLEGQYALRTGNLISLSEQNLVDCSGAYGNAACDGGWMGSAYNYIHDYGIMREDDYPYEATLGPCRYDAGRSVTSVSGYVDLPSGNEGSLADAVANVGPIAVAIQVIDSFQLYSSGVYYDASCGTQLNHGVLAAGYGDGYWLVKNSWGGSWGESGYIRMARDRGNNCGIATGAEYPVL